MANFRDGRSWSLARRRALARLLIVLPALFGLPACATDYNRQAEVRTFVAKMVRERGFTAEEVRATIAAAHFQQAIVDTMSQPAERTLSWKDYRKIFLTPARVEQGVAFWDANTAALARAQATYGVPPEIVVAIIGVETSYGRNVGNYRVLDALVTLAFDYPPRGPFFRGELEQYLLLAREQHLEPTALVGSYAGAMGLAQFIPSSYRSFAVDFDSDGAKDLWRNPTDAIGSVGNYFRAHEWRTGQAVVMQLPAPGPALDAVAGNDPEPKQRFSDLVGKAFTGGAISADEAVALFRFDGDNGVEYWLGLHNFYVITRYNHSPMYALAVYQLAQAVNAARTEGARAGQTPAVAGPSVTGQAP